MILRLVLILLPVFGAFSANIDKSGFYSVFSRGTLKEIDHELSVISQASFPEQMAYEGALLMRKAGKRTLPKDKLRDFRAGCTKLEGAIAADSTNAEYRFLRLCIQEQAPSVLNYRSDLQKDNLYIHLHFNQLTPVVQEAVRDYARHSRVLTPQNL